MNAGGWEYFRVCEPLKPHPSHLWRKPLLFVKPVCPVLVFLAVRIRQTATQQYRSRHLTADSPAGGVGSQEPQLVGREAHTSGCGRRSADARKEVAYHSAAHPRRDRRRAYPRMFTWRSFNNLIQESTRIGRATLALRVVPTGITMISRRHTVEAERYVRKLHMRSES